MKSLILIMICIVAVMSIITVIKILFKQFIRKESYVLLHVSNILQILMFLTSEMSLLSFYTDSNGTGTFFLFLCLGISYAFYRCSKAVKRVQEMQEKEKENIIEGECRVIKEEIIYDDDER